MSRGKAYRSADSSARLRNGYTVHGVSDEYLMERERIYMLIIAAVPCPKCGAAVGKDCRTGAGNRAIEAHWSRHEGWRATLAGGSVETATLALALRAESAGCLVMG